MDSKIIESPIGKLLAMANTKGIVSLDFVDDISEVRDSGKNIHLQKLEKQLNEYFAGKRKDFDVKLNYSETGTDFQKEVWKELLNIPYGKTISYQAEAKKLGNPKAVRAVANANGKNKIAIVIPCHRVIGSDGKLTGYASGVWRKKYLLELEGVITKE